MNWLIGIWGLLITSLFIGSFISCEAASFEPNGRYIYMVVLTVSVIAIALGLMRGKVKEK